MVVYWDTSAIVRHPSDVHSLLRGGGLHYTLSHLTELEVHCAVRRIRLALGPQFERQRRIALSMHARLQKVSLQREMRTLFRRALDLAQRYDLGSHDCLHLAAAMLVGDREDQPVRMASYDRRLREAAVAEGLSVFPEKIGNGR